MRRAAQDIVEIGERLIEVKAHLEYGQFQGWIKAEFDWTRQTAYRFMQVAERFKGCNNLLQVAPSALYLLASPSTPDEARAEALERAEVSELLQPFDTQIVALMTADEAAAAEREIITTSNRRRSGSV